MKPILKPYRRCPDGRWLDDRCHRPGFPGLDGARRRRDQDGIALLVVLVLFVIVILVVSQLQFSTKLEEELAEVRATESQGTFAIASMAAYVMSLLAEDYASNQGNTASMAMDPTGAGSAGMGDGGGRGGGLPAGGLPAGFDPGAMATGPGAGAAGEGATAAAPAGGAGSGVIDYLLENIFLENSQSISGVTVKIVIKDNERTFNLNHLWEYPRLASETLLQQQQDLQNEEARRAAGEEGADPDAAEDPAARDRANLDSALQGAQGAAAQANQPLNSSILEFIPPEEEKRERVREMLARAIGLMVRYNLDYGFLYRFQPPMESQLATAIEDYCYQRRSQTYQNTIVLVSELLNLPGVTPELYYGPMPDIIPGEEVVDSTGQFSYSKDEYGDLIGQYLMMPLGWGDDLEYRREQLEMLQRDFGAFASFPELGRMGNPMTRNMQEYPENFDATGLAVPPKPIGLRDLFSTVGDAQVKININTAPAPVLYGLLLSLSEEEAIKVALDIERYRYTYQEEISEAEAEGRVTDTETAARKDLGQPRRQPRTEEEKQAASSASYDPLAGLDPAAVEGLTDYENYATNYFTNLRQLVLIDGEEGGAEDLLNEQGGIEVNDPAFKSPFQRVMYDLEKVAAFGSSYFTATLKIKTEESPVVKEGNLVVHRNASKNLLEVRQWKELER